MTTSWEDDPTFPKVGTAAGPISLPERRRYQQERAAHITRCPICKTRRLPPADISRAACEFAGVEPARFAYSPADLRDDERADYLTLALQAMTIVLACRVRRRASNNNFMDALGTAFSVVYRHVRENGVARSIREMTEAHAKMVRRELQLVGIDLAGICAGPASTPMYTITRAETAGHGGRWRRGRRIVTLHAAAVAKFEALLQEGRRTASPAGVPVPTSSTSWLPTLADVWPDVESDNGEQTAADEQADDNRTEVEGWIPRYRVLAETKYEEVVSGDRAKGVLAFLERARVTLDVTSFHEDLQIADERHRELAGELERCGVSPELPRTKGEEAARRAAINRRARKLFPALARRSAWRRKTLAIVEEHDRVAAHVQTYKPHAERIRAGAWFAEADTSYTRTVNRRFQSLGTLWPAAVSDKVRAPWDERLRRRWFRSISGEPLVELDVSASQTQVLALLLGDTELEKIASGQSFKKFLARLAWDRSRKRKDPFRFREPFDRKGRYDGPADPRLLALVKEAWMRRLYGSRPWQIVEDPEVPPCRAGPGLGSREPGAVPQGCPRMEDGQHVPRGLPKDRQGAR